MAFCDCWCWIVVLCHWWLHWSCVYLQGHSLCRGSFFVMWLVVSVTVVAAGLIVGVLCLCFRVLVLSGAVDVILAEFLLFPAHFFLCHASCGIWVCPGLQEGFHWIWFWFIMIMGLHHCWCSLYIRCSIVGTLFSIVSNGIELTFVNS